jgi:phage tail sheath protein FI
MPVAPTYPGVYVQEIPSGVRTIVGVDTSIGMFLGRARTGELFKPVQCLSLNDFERAFTLQYARSDLARAVRLFFQNGGSRCHVMRIADSTAAPARVTLRTETGAGTLEVVAKSAGSLGNDIRVRVDYNTLQPEATFNLEVFRWTKTSTGSLVKSGIEAHQALSMNPGSPRYAKTVVDQNSALVTLNDAGLAPAATGFSQSGRAISRLTVAVFRAELAALFGAAVATNAFRISVDGNAPVDVTLAGLDFNTAPLNAATIPAIGNAIAGAINANLSGGASVTVTFEAGPAGQAAANNQATVYLRIASANGDVRVEPAALNDLAASLMLGTAQGGIEVSKFASTRPAPNGLVFDPGGAALPNLVAFAGLLQTGINLLTIGTKPVPLAGTFALTTTPLPIGPAARMWQDRNTAPAMAPPDPRADGVREKMAIMASAVTSAAANDPTLLFNGEVWGHRLAIVPIGPPSAAPDNFTATVSTGGTNIAGSFLTNVRYYSLGTSGTGGFQTAGAGGNDGGAPALGDYAKAYTVIDKEVDLFNLLVLPWDADHSPATTASLWSPASVFCQQRRAFLLMDPPGAWTDSQKAVAASGGVNDLRQGLVKDHGAIYFPRVVIIEEGARVKVGPSGAVAGLMARIDGSRGVWKAPAGTEADLRGVVGLEQRFSDGENGVLNPRAVNTLRVFPNGIVVWGARTMDGDDAFASEYKYVPIRRLALFMEESLYRGLKWVVFEPNDEPLWAQIRLNVGAFMHNLFRQGAFQTEGGGPRDSYFVRCDKHTTTQNDRNLGIVNIVVGFAPLKPAEFVILYLQQMAGQVQV